MPNIITSFGFVKRSGDSMTGLLDMQGNNIRLGTGAGIGCQLSGTSTNALRIRNPGDTDYADVRLTNIVAYGLVDGVNVSEIGKPAGGLYLVSDQLNIVNVTATLVELDNEIPDFEDGIENKVTHRITPAVAGFYMITGQLKYSSVVADHNYMAMIRRDGAVELAKSIIHAASAEDLAVVTGTIAYLSDSNYIELVAYHSAGVDTVDIESGAGVTFLTLERLR